MTKGYSPIVLDTHVWVWLVNGDRQLSAKARELIEEMAREGDVFVPSISVWEVAMLVSSKRLELAMPPDQWIEQALNRPGLSCLPLTAEVAVESCMLPGELPRDPADRFIVATARLLEAVLITRDSRLLKYAKAGFVRAVAG
jgi:PIN domain nuclease of toxin-antitoxin system